MPTSTTTDVALDHYNDRQRFVNGVGQVAEQMWSEVNPASIADTWAEQIPGLTAVVSGAQLGVARQADPYVTSSLDSQDVDADSVSPIDPTAFSGAASDGRGLIGLLTNPVIVTLMSIQDGMDVARAMGYGRANLDMLVRTQVADAGRAADQVALTARPKATGYVRIAVGNSCARCLLLAGQTYRWNAGFKRHPRCDCIALPAGIAKAGLGRSQLRAQNPRTIYDRMSRTERTRAGFTEADQRAIELGGDLDQIVNARHRPGALYTAEGRRFTREGTTKRGVAGSRLGARRGRSAARITPDQIFREAGDDRDEALRLLHRHGYLLENPARVLATVPAGVTGPLAAPFAVTLRPALARARSIRKVEQAFVAEARRLTGRTIPVDFKLQAVDIAADHAEGMLRVLTEFPDVPFTEVMTGIAARPVYAQAWVQAGRIDFDVRMAGDSAKYRATMRRDAANGYHMRGASTPTGTAAHEMAHIVHHHYDSIDLNRKVSRLLEKLSAEAGIDVVTYVQRELGGYAIKHIDEMIAEAISDALMSGPAASRLSREVMELLRQNYRAGRKVSEATTKALASEALDLTKLTVPQLRALAKARGITIPTGARKPDIVRLLDEGDVPAGRAGIARRLDEGAPIDAALDRIVKVPASAPRRLRATVETELRRQAELAPGLLDDIREIRIATPERWAAANRQHGREGGRHWAYYDQTLHEIVLHPDYATAAGRRRIDAAVKGSYDNQHLAWSDVDYATTSEVLAASVLRHEIGHAAASRWPADIGVWNTSKSLRAQVIDPLADALGVPAPAATRDLAEWWDTAAVQSAARSRISGYAAGGGIGEALAEIWAVYVGRGQAAPRLSKRMGDVIRADWARRPGAVPDLQDAARVRQAVIDTHRGVADTLSEVAGLLDNEASTRLLTSRAEAIAARTSGEVKKSLAALVRAMKTGDTAKVERAITAAARKLGLRRGSPAGEIVDYDRAIHGPIAGESIAAGAKVRIVRPGYDATINGEDLRLSKAVVEPLSAAEIKEIERRALRAAARERNKFIESKAGTARLLAEVDELIAKGAEAKVIRQRLDPALIGPEQPFAGADPAILDALTKALTTGPAALRSAVTRATTKAKLKPVSKAGAKAKFDPDTMEPVSGVDIPAGAPVTVVTRGTSVTLPDGTVLQLSKARVTVVPTKAAKATAKPTGPAPAKAVQIEDIFTADDAVIEAALRDVYEGRFGPYTTKVEVSITRAGTRVDGRGRTIAVEPRIHVGGKIYAHGVKIGDRVYNDVEIGNFGRSISPSDSHYADGVIRREIWAEHHILQMEDKYQGKGFGGEFNRRAMDWYRRSGVRGISQSDHNGYTWASQGFGFSGGIVPETVIDGLHDMIDALRAGRTKTRLDDVIPKALREAPDLSSQIAAAEDVLRRIRTLKPGQPGYPTAYEISQIGRREGQRGKTAVWLGKKIWVSANELILNPNQGVVIS